MFQAIGPQRAAMLICLGGLIGSLSQDHLGRGRRAQAGQAVGVIDNTRAVVPLL